MTGKPQDDGGIDRERMGSSRWVTHEIGEDERPSEAVVRVVAALTNRSPLDLDPLYGVIDPDHLDGVIEDSDDTLRAELSFGYESCRVTVTEGHVRAHTSTTDE